MAFSTDANSKNIQYSLSYLFTYFLFTYLRTSCLCTDLLTIYFSYLFTYLFTFNGQTLFPALGNFCTSDNGKTTRSVYDGIVVHYVVPTSFKHGPILTG